MKHVSFTTTLYTLALLPCLVGCYSTIPATDIEPFFVCDAPLLTREIHKLVSTSTKSKALPEKITVEGIPFDVYFTDSVTYAYDTAGRLLRERITYSDGSGYGSDFSYAPGKMVAIHFSTNKLGVVSSPSSSTYALNAKGYIASLSYNADDQLIEPDAAGQKAQTWVNGNLVRRLYDNDGLLVKTIYYYDLSRKSLPSPHQFSGKGNRNLIIGALTSPSLGRDTVRSTNTYLFTPQGYVKRILGSFKEYHRGILLANTPPELYTVTDYEYACP